MFFFPSQLIEYTKLSFDFSNLLCKASSKSFVVLDFQHLHFRPLKPCAVWSDDDAEHSLNVGLYRTYVENGRITRWELVFLLEDHETSTTGCSWLFGRVTRGDHILRSLSRTPTDKREQLTITWEIC